MLWTAVGIPGAASLATILGPESMRPVAARVFDVTAAPFKAHGDGAYDDGPAIQAAIDAAAEAGGGVVRIPAGRYLLASVQEQRGFRYYLLDMHSNVTVQGDGVDRTVLLTGGGMPDQTRVLSTDGRRHVARITFADFTIDGNAAQQLDAGSMVGISCGATLGAIHRRVRVHDVKGSAVGEGTAFDSYGAKGSLYRQCQADRVGAGTTGSGFSATQAEDIVYADCEASGSTHWQGFTTYLSKRVSYVRCLGTQNNQRGLNCEQSEQVDYVDCQAGGMPGQGNRGDGFCLFQSKTVSLSACRSLGNLDGLINSGSSAVRVLGGEFHENVLAGLAFATQEDFQNSEVSGSPIVAPNRLGPLFIAGSFYESLP